VTAVKERAASRGPGAVAALRATAR
jgi:hypothetical protein